MKKERRIQRTFAKEYKNKERFTAWFTYIYVLMHELQILVCQLSEWKDERRESEEVPKL